jgi:hypothetical protein
VNANNISFGLLIPLFTITRLAGGRNVKLPPPILVHRGLANLAD